MKQAIYLLDSFKAGHIPPGTTNRDLWEAQKLKQAIFHPDTGEKVFAPFRMSGFVPFGWITVTGMLLPNPSWPTLIFWQWMNQSHNACVNYANRNATNVSFEINQNYGTGSFLGTVCNLLDTYGPSKDSPMR